MAAICAASPGSARRMVMAWAAEEGGRPSILGSGTRCQAGRPARGVRPAAPRGAANRPMRPRETRVTLATGRRVPRFAAMTPVHLSCPAFSAPARVADMGDAGLARRMAMGDAWALDVIYRRHAPALRRYARRFVDP